MEGMTRESWVKNAEFGQKFMKSFHSGVVCLQNPKLWGVKQIPQSEQAIGQEIHCRDILFIPRCSPRAREFAISVNFSVRRTVAELRGFKVAQFSDFGRFSPHKTRKTYLPMKSLQPMGYIAEWLRFFHVVVEGPKECGVFLRLLVGELWTPKLAHIFACGKWLYPYRMLLHGASDLDRRCLKTRRSAIVAFLGGSHQTYLPLPPKLPPKPQFGGPFNANLLQIELSVVAR